MSNQENQPSKLPAAPLVQPDITEGVTPLPATSLLSESERKRLEELAATGEAPIVIKAPGAGDEIATFEDGSVFKYMPRPGPTEHQILVDASGKQYGIIRNENLADFICNACNMFVLAQIKCEAEGKAMEIVHTPRIIPGR
jgi:hypothetical protein